MCLIGVGSCHVFAPQVFRGPALAPAFAPAFGPVGPVAPVALAPVNTEYDPHPQYSFAYNVADALTGDQKNQQEVRDGDVVKGIKFRRFILFSWLTLL